MIRMTLSAAAAATHARLVGSDAQFAGCSTDSRRLQAGELFIALQGENFDGHAFINEAQAKGAVAALIQQETVADKDFPLLKTRDTRRALGALAGEWRRRFSIPVLAITGSNGKTTLKEMLLAILSQQAPVLATMGNRNNDIGVPLTLFGLGAEHRFAVIEMGANHCGEIARLTEMAAPTVAVITQCASAHLEGFGSIENVAKAKAEIFSGLQENGIAIINADDEFACLWRETAGANRQLSFAVHAQADVVARDIRVDAETGHAQFSLEAASGEERIKLPLPGAHNVANALAAAACCLALDLPLPLIKSGLEGMAAIRGRLEAKQGRGGIRILDDSYNANPASLAAAIKAASCYVGAGWLVLGDMAELGESAAAFHYQAGEQARAAGMERLYAVGTLSEQAAKGFGQGARHFATRQALINALAADVRAGVTLLVKGSRSMAMEQVVAAMQEGS